MRVSLKDARSALLQNAVGLDLKTGIRWISGSPVPLEKRLPMLSGRVAGARCGLAARGLGTRATEGV